MKLLLALFLVCSPVLRAAEPFLKPNDVIALVGGEDMVAAAEYGYLELLLQRALPEHRLKVRSLAWEGDTVFEQPRDLNYPSLEAQLDEIGATVVIMQFGQMESLAGTSKLPEFIKAYEKLIERVSAGGKRRVALLTPMMFDARSTTAAAKVTKGNNESRGLYAAAVEELAKKPNALFIDWLQVDLQEVFTGGTEWPQTRESVHLSSTGLSNQARGVANALLFGDVRNLKRYPGSGADLAELVRAKNRLWFHYYRPQNWAFLAGDRTEQPSSRDHKDPSKRWFPEEMKQWLPLIEAKEKEIWALAAKAAKP